MENQRVTLPLSHPREDFFNFFILFDFFISIGEFSCGSNPAKWVSTFLRTFNHQSSDVDHSVCTFVEESLGCVAMEGCGNLVDLFVSHVRDTVTAQPPAKARGEKTLQIPLGLGTLLRSKSP